MICADTSTWVNFLKGVGTHGAEQLDHFLSHGSLLMSPPVLTELLSFPGIEKSDRELFRAIPKIVLQDNFWERTGELRSGLLKMGFKPRMLDCLIAQSCIDEGVPLLADDDDFKVFTRMGLKLIE